MHYSYLCCKHFFVETKHNSKHSPSLMTKYLAMLYHVELNVATKVPERKSLYPLLTQKIPYLISEIKIKFRSKSLTHDVSIIWYEIQYF